MSGVSRRLDGLLTLSVALLLGACLLAACRPAPELTDELAQVPVETACVAVLYVDSAPSDADLYLGGEPIGRTPQQLSLAPGLYRITLRREGFATHRTDVELRCGDDQTLSPRLHDVTPPTIVLHALPALVAPEEGLKVVARATDNDAVASLALFVDESLLHSVQEASLRHNVDTRALPAGVHQGRIVARDAAGNQAAVTFQFEIVAAATGASTPAPPTPDLQTPAPQQTTTITSFAPAQPMATPIPTNTPTRTPTATPPPTATPRPVVAVSEGQISLMIYDYEGALYTDPGRVGHPYPLLDHDRVGPPVSRIFHAITLRNEYLEVVVLPELGGRIYQIRYLPTGQPLLYNSRVAKVTPWGPEDQGWWLALGGIEWALPEEEHGYVSAQPWEAQVSRGADGSATVSLRILEGSRQIDARVEITLRPRESAVHLRTTLRNQSDRSQSYQYWVNAMLSPGRHGVGPDLRFTLPADSVTVHSTGDNTLPPEGAAMPWPVAAGRDLSRYGNWHNWLGVFAPQLRAPFLAVYDEAAQIGMVHAFPPEIMRGSKFFGFGRDFDHSTYADDGAQYVELWGGLTPSFWQYTTLAPGASTSWEDTWYVVAQSGGVDFANPNASLYARRDGDRVRLTVASPGQHQWRLIVSQDGRELVNQTFLVRPDAPHRVSVDVGNPAAGLDVRILRSDGGVVLQHRMSP
jgi:hypothetical protein